MSEQQAPIEHQVKTELNEDQCVVGVEVPIYLNYHFTAGSATSRFLEGMKQGRILGQRCPSCSAIYVPPRGSCAKCGVATTDEVELPMTGVIESFTVVYIPLPNSVLKPPFIAANIVIDGSDIAFVHLVSEVDLEQVRIGMRVQAHWKPEEEWIHNFENIAYFKPLDEPDVDIEALRAERLQMNVTEES